MFSKSTKVLLPSDTDIRDKEEEGFRDHTDEKDLLLIHMRTSDLSWTLVDSKIQDFYFYIKTGF